MNLEELRQRLVVLNGEAQNITNKARDENRDLTVEESAQLDATLEAFDRTKADVDRLEKLNSQTDILVSGNGRRTEPDQPVQHEDIGDGEVDRVKRRPGNKAAVGNLTYLPPRGDWNFKSLGEFAVVVKRACVNGGQLDRRLELSEKLASATTYGTEGVGADGGFAVPPDFRTAIMSTVMGETSLLSRCDNVPTQGNSFTSPIDETTPWQTSGGILAYWDGEAVAATQSKPALQEQTVKLNKLRALVPVTEELLDDAAAMDAYLRRKAPEKIAFKVSHAVAFGTGVGQPLGFMNSGALITVSKESSQVADTLVANNVIKMYARMYAQGHANAVWLINQDILPQLFKLSIPGTDNTGNAVSGWGGLVYTPANGLAGTPYGTLFGKPVIITQVCETLGDLGDIMYVDLSQYLALLKSGPNPRVETSMHLWFDQDLIAYKFVLRVGGKPWWSTSYSARDGSATYSPFVTLEAR